MHALNEQSPTVYKRDPLYRQIARQLRRQILSGEFEAGDALPPVRHLAAEHGVHFNTIARSYRLLEQEGLVTMRPGRGTRVEPNRPERDATPDPIFKAMISDCLDLGLRLGLTREEGISRLKQMLSQMSGAEVEDTSSGHPAARPSNR